MVSSTPSLDPRPQTPNKVLSKQFIQLYHRRRIWVKPIHSTVSCCKQPGKGCQGPDTAPAKVVSSREPGGGMLTMKEGDYNWWFLSYSMSALDKSDCFSSVVGKQDVAPRGSQNGPLVHFGEFSSRNTVSSSIHSIFERLWTGDKTSLWALQMSHGLRGSNLCDICDKVLWLSITFNCRT